jgi:hypothetical protein
MKKDQFEQLVKPLGETVRVGQMSAVDTADNFKFRLFPRNAPCPDCFGHNRQLQYTLKYRRDGESFWQTKCLHCKSKWQELRL